MRAIQLAISRLVSHQDLDPDLIGKLLDEISRGIATDSQIGGFLVGLTSKGPKQSEIAEIAKAMRAKAVPVRPRSKIFIDTCGTGGGRPTFNVSTASGLLVSTKVPVCKHGSRSISSKSGSADVQEALGIDIHMDARGVEKMVDEVGYGFMFAPYFHPIMGRVVKPEFELGIKTIFYTLIGPLISPADVKRHVLGVFKRDLVEPVAHILAEMGYQHALIVHGLDGFDEISITGETLVAEVKDSKLKDIYKIHPQDLGLKPADLNSIIEDNPAHQNAQIILRIFERKELGPRRDFLIINAAAGLYVGNVVKDLKDGVELASQIIDEGQALEQLQRIIQKSKEISHLHPAPKIA